MQYHGIILAAFADASCLGMTNIVCSPSCHADDRKHLHPDNNIGHASLVMLTIGSICNTITT